jgi:CBS domain-containing protein
MRAAVRLQTLGFEQVYRYTDGKMEWAANGLPVEGEHAQLPRLLDIAQRDVPTCRLTDALTDVRGPLCVVTDEHGIVLGQVTQAAVRPNASIEEVMEPAPPTYRPNVSLEELWTRLENHPRVQHVLVSTPEGELLGVVWRTDLEEVIKGEHEHTHSD